MLTRPLTENEFIARSICEELSNIELDNRNEIIQVAAKKIMEEITQEGNLKLVNAIQNELRQCYPKLFLDKKLISA